MGVRFRLKGGVGSGHRGHTGRPGSVGGSAPGVGAGGAASKLVQGLVSNIKAESLDTPTLYDLLGKAKKSAGKGGKWDALTPDELKLTNSVLADMKRASRAAIRGVGPMSPAHAFLIRMRGYTKYVRDQMPTSTATALKAPLAKLVDVFGADEIWASKLGWSSAAKYVSGTKTQDPDFEAYRSARG